MRNTRRLLTVVLALAANLSVLTNVAVSQVTATVGRQQDVFRPYSFGLSDFPDGLMGVFRHNGTYYWLMGSFPPSPDLSTPQTFTFRFVGNRLGSMRPDPIGSNGLAVPVFAPGNPGTYDDQIGGNGSVFLDRGSGKLYFWYQATKNIPEDISAQKKAAVGNASYAGYGGVGLATSDDLGQSFQRAGVALSLNLSEQRFYEVPKYGVSDPTPPSVVRNGDYLYMYYIDYREDETGPNNDKGLLAVARLRVTELNLSPQPWKKYYKGRFSEPAGGGRFTPIAVNTLFPVVTYNTYLKRWLMVHTWDNNSFYVRTSRDGINWSKQGLLLRSKRSRDLMISPTVIGLGDDPQQRTGRRFWLYYASAPNERAEPFGWLVRRMVGLK